MEETKGKDFDQVLEADESLLWTGKPERIFDFRKAYLLICIATLSVIIYYFSVHIYLFENHLYLKILDGVFGLFFFLVIIENVIALPVRLKNTRYAITDKRAIRTSKFLAESLIALPLKQLTGLDFFIDKSGMGELFLGSSGKLQKLKKGGISLVNRSGNFEFVKLRDSKPVLELLEQAIFKSKDLTPLHDFDNPEGSHLKFSMRKGESVQWQKSPAVPYRIGKLPSEIVAVIFILFWSIGAWITGWWLFICFSVPFLISGIYLAYWIFILRPQALASSHYLITNQRAIILRTRPFERYTYFELGYLSDLKVFHHKDLRGNLMFNAKSMKKIPLVSMGKGAKVPIFEEDRVPMSFDRLENADEVLRILNSQITGLQKTDDSDSGIRNSVSS